MVFLILSIGCATSIFLIFKIMENYKIAPLPVIILNYLAAAVFGILAILMKGTHIDQEMIHWIPGAVVVGLAFIVMFFLIARSIQSAGITSTSVASKMSVVIPVLFSIWFYTERPGWVRSLGIVMAFLALFLTLYKPEKNQTTLWRKRIALPLVIFIGSGLVDSMVKYMQDRYLGEQDFLFFNVVVFSVALISGLLWMLLAKENMAGFRKRNYQAFGLILGLTNFGSLLFFIKALESEFIGSSVIFTINNVGVVTFTVLIAFLFFKEKLNWYNWLGIILAFTAIALMT